MPAPLRELHDTTADRRWSGVADLRRGRGVVAKLSAGLFGFPQAARQVPVTVSFSTQGGAERWERSFAGKTFYSVQAAGTGSNEHLLVERFGPASFALAMVVEGNRLILIPRGWSLFGVPMPRACCLPARA